MIESDRGERVKGERERKTEGKVVYFCNDKLQAQTILVSFILSICRRYELLCPDSKSSSSDIASKGKMNKKKKK